MSRVYVKPLEGTPVTSIWCGIDHVLGWFVQVFEGEDRDPVIDIPDRLSAICGMNRTKVVQIIDRYGDSEDPRNKKIRDYLIMDLDPAEVDREYA